MAQDPNHTLTHLTGDELAAYKRFVAAFPHRELDVKPFGTGHESEVDSWVLAGEPAVWPPVPAEAPPAAGAAADGPELSPEPVAAWDGTRE